MITTLCHRAAAATVDQCGVWSAWADGLPVGRIRHNQKSGWVVDVHVRPAAHRSACLMSVGLCRNSAVAYYFVLSHLTIIWCTCCSPLLILKWCELCHSVYWEFNDNIIYYCCHFLFNQAIFHTHHRLERNLQKCLKKPFEIVDIIYFTGLSYYPWCVPEWLPAWVLLQISGPADNTQLAIKNVPLCFW